MARRAQELLGGHQFTPNYVLGAIVCRECEYIVSWECDKFRRHLREKHPKLLKHQKALCLAANICAEKMTKLHSLQPKYYNPEGSLLQQVEGLPVLTGFKCPDCNWLSASLKSMQKHRRNKHPSKERGLHVLNVYMPVKLQTLRKRKGLI